MHARAHAWRVHRSSILEIERFRETSSNEATGWAAVGQAKLALLPAHHHRGGTQCMCSAEQLLIETVITSIQSAQPHFCRSLIIEYYTALKRTPLVLLSGPNAAAAAELARLFAEAIVGQYSAQVVHISGAAWHDATGEGSYYRSLHERFSAMRCQAVAHEANSASNLGKAFFVSFDALPSEQIASHLDLLFAEATESLAMSAVLPTTEVAAMHTRFPCAAVMQVPDGNISPDERRLPPPVGLQRLWLQACAEVCTMPLEQPQHTLRMVYSAPLGLDQRLAA